MAEMSYDNCMMQEDKDRNSQRWFDLGWSRAVSEMPAMWNNPEYMRGYEAGASWLFELHIRKLSKLR